MQLPESDQDYYIPRIRWTNTADQLAIFKLNRNQNRLDMLMANPKSTLTKLVLRQEDKYYIDYQNIDYIQFTPDNQFFFGVSEQDGFRHIYQYRINGSVYKQITKGTWDITDFYGYDHTKQILYYQSAEVSPMQRDIYAIDAKAKKTRLANGKGTHDASFNSTYSYYLDVFSSIDAPEKIILYNPKGVQIRVIESNSKLQKDFDALQLPKKEFFSFNTSDNIKLNGWIL